MLMLRSKKLVGIDPRSWEHPADRAALAALRQLPGFDEIARKIMSLTSERSLRLLFIANAVKVSPTQFPRIKTMIDKVTDIFDWPQTPDVFVSQSPFLNAGTYGADAPFIVLNSSALKSLDDDELCSVIAHEMGHIMSGHVLYKTLLYFLLNISLSFIPGADIAVIPIVLALKEWDRKSELTADRAGLLAVQNEEANYRLLMKMAGGDDVSQLNLNDFFNQAAEYEAKNDLVDSVHKLMNLLGETHPFAVIRLKELKTWAAGGHYSTILSGSYLRKGVNSANSGDEFKTAWDSYQNDFGASEDPLAKAAKGVGDFLSQAGNTINATLGDIFGNNKRP